MKRNTLKIFICILLIALVIIAIITYKFYNYRSIAINSANDNKTYKSFYNKQVLGTDVVTLINKTMDNNKQNGVKKNNDGTFIGNELNSVNIEVKFKELDKPIKMEKIYSQDTINFVQNFGAESFICTKIEYHKKTGNVKYMYFEQV